MKSIIVKNLVGFCVVLLLTACGEQITSTNLTDNPGSLEPTADLSLPISDSSSGVVTVSVDNIDFGRQELGGISDPLSLTVTNNSSMPLTVSNITISSDFIETNNCNDYLPADLSCSFDIQFVPTVPGDAIGVLSITDSTTGSPYVVNLAGIGSIDTPSALIASGPIVINGDQDVVISGLHISNPNGDCIQVQNGSSRITIENSEIGPCGDKGINIGYSDNVTVHNNYIHDTGLEAVWSYESDNIAVDSNVFIDVRSGYDMWKTSIGNLSFTNNFVKNVHLDYKGISGGNGDGTGGSVVAVMFVKGGEVRITDNVGINIAGQSSTIDLVNVYKSKGSAAKPIYIARNKFNGGGPVDSSGGIILGDTGGAYQLAEDNILVNPGQYGLAISGGNNNTHRNNRVYSDNQRDFTNVGLYVWRINHPTEGGTPAGGCYGHTVEQNQVTWWKGPDYKGNGQPATRLASWNPSTGSDSLAPNCGSVVGWGNNLFDTDSSQPANLDASLWNSAWNTPAFLPQNPYYY